MYERVYLLHTFTNTNYTWENVAINMSMEKIYLRSMKSIFIRTQVCRQWYGILARMPIDIVKKMQVIMILLFWMIVQFLHIEILIKNEKNSSNWIIIFNYFTKIVVNITIPNLCVLSCEMICGVNRIFASDLQ